MEIRIYVACLASYNAGELHGKWIDANQPPKEIFAEISAMLKASPERGSEEWAVHDYEGFGGLSLSEWPSIERVSKIAGLIEEHGDAFSLWYSVQDGQHFETEELEEKFLEQWQGAHDSKEAFADYLLDSTGQLSELPEFARRYFNFESYARDLELSGDYAFVRANGQVYAFSSH
jgi:antirestriction protein